MSILKRIVQIIGDVRALKKIEKSDDVVRVILLKFKNLTETYDCLYHLRAINKLLKVNR